MNQSAAPKEDQCRKHGRYYRAYQDTVSIYCVLKKGHDGDCYSDYEKIWFRPI